MVDHAIVEGQTGSAILVNGTALEGANASITIQNQSTLLSGNGTLLEVANNSTAAFTVDNSSLTGDVQVGQGSSAHVNLQNHATLTGQLNNVGQLAVNSGAVWNMVGPASVANIALADGTINLSPDGAAFHRLDIGNLSGNGTFGMRVDLAQLQGDFLNVSGNASGQHGLAIRNTGVEPVKGADPLHVVQIAGGDAKFEAIGNNGMVDAGTFKYVLEQQGNGWYLVQAHDDEGNPIVTPSTQAVLGLFNTAPTIWYGEDASLRSRMGELRFNQSASGAWVRSYGTRVNVDGRAGQPYRHTQYGFTAGADKSIPVATGKLFVGALGGYSRNDLDFGSATTGSIDSFYAGGYATWLGNNGYYVDGVIKGNMFRNDAKVRMSDGSAANGSYTNFGLGASVEFGRQIGLANGWFIEPSARVSAFVSSGATTRLDNGLEAAGSPNKSFQTRIGAALGRNLELANGSTLQPYVKVGLVQEFARGNDVNVNGNRFDSDLAGTRVELGAGVAARVTKTLQLHGDVLYAKGAKLTQPWGVNLGLRYLF
ncbi:pertactin family autotransporter [Burkholderia humptydooensis]|uniref:Pertactin family autotransporter n=2 Tax=Burkholderia humptydooensis TaxID=430531 RepID=A0A7U4PB99_9BURK|nr:transporter [Burkholderia humptydooensis]EIP84391.1 Outer membrane autotransporter barrel [Burkholderia humptydooensis MSMB43]QPS47960.1 pertactin family autotransporter [Burkholderia humptydooensis]